MTAFLLRIAAALVLLCAGVMVFVQFDSRGWPQTTGMITVSDNTRNGLGEVTGTMVRYDYRVDGKDHSGSRVSYDDNVRLVQIVKAQADDAADVERAPQPGDVVKVHYASWWPGICVLVPGPAPTVWLWGAVAGMLAVILLVFAALSKHPIY